ncbi:MAG: ABC transporter substrate-binding protein [Desulfopila sp.]|jgi:branched-chain amino acid transport system substrate-binding protein|nr:ABC transporter substrate-binding protein [Desulfopila sp.]
MINMNKWMLRSLSMLAMTVILLLGPAYSRADTIKVGAILAATGPASFLGGPAVRSLKMLLEEVNSKGLAGGHTIELIIKDSGGSSEKAVSFAKQLIEEEKVFAIIGPSTSGETFKIKKLCDSNQTILISCASAELIVNPVAPFVFKTAPSDSLAARKIFMTMNEMGISKVAVLTGNTGFGKAGKQQLTEIAPEYGIELVESEVYDGQATDLSAIVVKIKANQDVEAVINWSIVPAQSIIAKNIRQVGWDVPLFQSHGFANIKYVEAAGAAAEGIIFPASRLIVAESLPDSKEKDFLMHYKNGYEKKFGEAASTFGGHSYDALMILTRAIAEVGPDKLKVRDAIERMTGYFGTAGEFNFSPEDHSGLGIDAFTMVTVKDTRFVPYVMN